MYGIELKKINAFGNRIEYQFSADNTLRDYFNPEQKFVIEYFFDNQKLDLCQHRTGRNRVKNKQVDALLLFVLQRIVRSGKAFDPDTSGELISGDRVFTE